MTQEDNITFAQLQQRLDEAFSQIELLKYAYTQLSNQLSDIVEPSPPKDEGFTRKELGALLGFNPTGPIPQDFKNILNRDWVFIDKKWYRKL